MVEACGHACVLAEDPTLVDLWCQNSENARADRRYIEAFKTGRLFPETDADRKLLKERYALFSLRTHPSAIVWHSHRVATEGEGFVFDNHDAKTPADVLDHFVLIIDTLIISLRAISTRWRARANPDSFVEWDKEFQFMCDRFGRHMARMREVRGEVEGTAV
jgi:hypothetical protein